MHAEFREDLRADAVVALLLRVGFVVRGLRGAPWRGWRWRWNPGPGG